LPEAASVPEVGFNSRYLLNMLEHAGAAVTMAQTNPAHPAAFSDPADPSWVEIVTPKRV
jgi:DNA polymerase III sliding clamp (beta) subunit (PCNA family)